MYNTLVSSSILCALFASSMVFGMETNTIVLRQGDNWYTVSHNGTIKFTPQLSSTTPMIATPHNLSIDKDNKQILSTSKTNVIELAQTNKISDMQIQRIKDCINNKPAKQSEAVKVYIMHGKLRPITSFSAPTIIKNLNSLNPSLSSHNNSPQSEDERTAQVYKICEILDESAKKREEDLANIFKEIDDFFIDDQVTTNTAHVAPEIINLPQNNTNNTNSEQTKSDAFDDRILSFNILNKMHAEELSLDSEQIKNSSQNLNTDNANSQQEKVDDDTKAAFDILEKTRKIKLSLDSDSGYTKRHYIASVFIFGTVALLIATLRYCPDKIAQIFTSLKNFSLNQRSSFNDWMQA